jgi:hypothetical protein
VPTASRGIAMDGDTDVVDTVVTEDLVVGRESRVHGAGQSDIPESIHPPSLAVDTACLEPATGCAPYLLDLMLFGETRVEVRIVAYQVFAEGTL